MKSSKTIFAIAGLGLILFLVAPPARADKEWKSPLNLGETTEIPGTVLEPGRYVVKVIDVKTPRKVVQFLNEDETKVYATVMAVPSYRVTTKGEGEFVYFQRAEGRPQALKTWFYPANNFGIEFVYPKVAAMQIAETSREPVYAAETARPAAEEKVTTITPEMKEIPWKAPEAPGTMQPDTTVAESAPQNLPRTASDLPLIGLAGLAALAAAFGLRSFSLRRSERRS